MNNSDLIEMIQNLISTYNSMVAYFYQKISQDQYTNNTLSTYPIDYTLLLSGSQFIKILSESQVDSQIQYYVDLCNAISTYISTSVIIQTDIVTESIQNSVSISIANLNGFAKSLLKAQFGKVFNYTVLSDSGMTTILYLNNISLDTYPSQILLNANISDFNNIREKTILRLSR